MQKIGGMKLETDRQETTISPDGSIDVFVPISFKRAGGRKLIMTPCQPDQAFTPPHERDSLTTALIKAFQWKERIEKGEYTSMQDLARKQKTSTSYVCRIIRMTFLAPDIIEAILDGRQPKQLTLQNLLQPLPFDWMEQRKRFMYCG